MIATIKQKNVDKKMKFYKTDNVYKNIHNKILQQIMQL